MERREPKPPLFVPRVTFLRGKTFSTVENRRQAPQCCEETWLHHMQLLKVSWHPCLHLNNTGKAKLTLGHPFKGLVDFRKN